MSFFSAVFFSSILVQSNFRSSPPSHVHTAWVADFSFSHSQTVMAPSSGKISHHFSADRWRLSPAVGVIDCLAHSPCSPCPSPLRDTNHDPAVPSERQAMFGTHISPIGIRCSSHSSTTTHSVSDVSGQGYSDSLLFHRPCGMHQNRCPLLFAHPRIRTLS